MFFIWFERSEPAIFYVTAVAWKCRPEATPAGFHYQILATWKAQRQLQRLTAKIRAMLGVLQNRLLTQPEVCILFQEQTGMPEKSREGGELKDVTVTSFGLIIAYLLPGLAGLYGLSFWSPMAKAAFDAFPTTESNLGLFFIVILASLTIGMIAHGIRWVVFEVWLGNRLAGLTPEDFERLSGERRMEAFRGAVDEIYRYHQWWGGITVTAPVVFYGWLTQPAQKLPSVILAAIAFTLLEALSVYAAIRIREQYVIRVQAILKGGDQ